MRVLLASLVVLGAFAGSTLGFAIWGSSKVAARVEIETSCRLLDIAEQQGMLTRSQRFDVIYKVAASDKVVRRVREAADRLRTGCTRR